MLVALFNSNRDAFDGNNMNRLRAGKILRLPDAAEVAKVDAGTARKLILGQNTEFNAYRRRLAEAAGAAPLADEAPTQQASGTIKPRVEEKAPPVAAKDKLEVSRTETAKSAKAVGGSNLEEDLIARDKALREASERIVDLEKNIENLKHLVELKSQTGAKLQQEAQTAPAQAPQLAEAKPAAPSAEPAAPPTATEPVKPVEPTPAAVQPPPAPAVAKPEVKKPAAPPPAPPEPDFIAENPQLVYGGGALAALLLGYFGYAARRKKKASGDEEWQNELAVATPKAGAETSPSAAVFGAASESVDNGEVSIQGDFSDIGMLTTEEKVDPVAEADVLMAYGRDRQAEEILLEGLRQDSGRAAIHMKLLELYAKQENIAEFETIANELHKLNGGRGADWERTQAMALKLGLAGGVFLGAKSAMAGTQDQEAPDEYPAVSTQDQLAGAEALDAGTASPEAEQPVDEDTGALDFDLDLGTTDGGPAAAVDVAAAVATPAPEEAMSLDFDFDLGTPESAPPQAQEASSQASANVVVDDGSIDFALDLGSDANATAEASAEPVESAAADLAMDVAELDFDLDLGSVETPDAIEAPEVAALAEPAEEVSSSAAPAELPAIPAHESAGAEAPDDLQIDFDLELDVEPVPAAAAPAPLDLADISLDLDDVEPVAPGAGQGQSDVLEMALEEVASADVVATTESDRASSEEGYVEVAPAMQPDNPEVTTKLELAQAYEEMGDQEGARDLLNEVLNEGSAAQQAEARLRLDQLGI
jgi:pilus assembly protein FimV